MYDIAYTYDQVGNRLTRADAVSGRETNYFYDSSSNPAHVMGDPVFITANNRLVRYEEFDPAWAGGASPVRVVRYYYYQTGDVANIIVKDEGVPPVEDPERYAWHRSLACYYTTSGQLWQVL